MTEMARDNAEFLSPLASFSDRIIGALIDGFLVVAITVLTSYALRQIDESILNGVINSDNKILLIALLSDYLLRGLLLCSVDQCTIGQRMMRLRTERIDQKPIGIGTASLRYIVGLLSQAIFLIGYVVGLFTKRRQTLHDLVAGTIVVLRVSGRSDLRSSQTTFNSGSKTQNNSNSPDRIRTMAGVSSVVIICFALAYISHRLWDSGIEPNTPLKVNGLSSQKEYKFLSCDLCITSSGSVSCSKSLPFSKLKIDTSSFEVVSLIDGKEVGGLRTEFNDTTCKLSSNKKNKFACFMYGNGNSSSQIFDGENTFIWENNVAGGGSGIYKWTCIVE